MFLALVGRKHLDDFFTYQTADPEDVAAVDSGKVLFPKGNRTLHFGPDYMTSKWNRCCIEGMVDYLLENGVNDWPGAMPILGREVLVSLIRGWLIQAQGNWKSAFPRVDPVTGQVETPKEALSRALAYKTHRKATSKARQRKVTVRSHRYSYDLSHFSQKHNKRVLTTEQQMAKYPPESAEYRLWKQRKELTEELGVNGMSSEDEEAPMMVGPVTRMVRLISQPRFLSTKASREMHSIDQVAKTPTHGAPRTYTGKVSQNTKTPAPVGLAEDCYDKAWLASLPPGALEDLKVKRVPHPLVQPAGTTP